MILRGYLRGENPSSGDHSGISTLTAREREVLQLLAEGKTTTQVAITLDLSIKTAKHIAPTSWQTSLPFRHGIGSLCCSPRHCLCSRAARHVYCCFIRRCW